MILELCVQIQQNTLNLLSDFSFCLVFFTNFEFYISGYKSPSIHTVTDPSHPKRSVFFNSSMRKRPTLSPLERAEIILPFPTKTNYDAPVANPFRHADWKKPERVLKKRYQNSKRQRRSSFNNIRSSNKQKLTPLQNQSTGFAADTMRLVNEMPTNGSTSILETVQALSIIQKGWRLKQWKKQLTKKFQVLCYYREKYETHNAIVLQCLIRSHLARKKVIKRRLDWHSFNAILLQSVIRKYIRNQQSKRYLRAKLLAEIRPLVPSAHRISALIVEQKHSQRSKSFSHRGRGGITEKELSILKEISSVGLRDTVHTTYFVELLDGLRWVQSINRKVQARHISYISRRTCSLQVFKEVLEEVSNQRLQQKEFIKKKKIKQKVMEDMLKQHQEKIERKEREQMWREDNAIKMDALRIIREENRKQLVIDREERERKEMIFRMIMIEQKKKKWLNSKRLMCENMIERLIEQSVYLVMLRVKGKRKATNQ